MKWIILPGGRIKRWRKSRTDDRPGWGVSRLRTVPRGERNLLNRQERRRYAEALSCGRAEVVPYVHPRKAASDW